MVYSFQLIMQKYEVVKTGSNIELIVDTDKFKFSIDSKK